MPTPADDLVATYLRALTAANAGLAVSLFADNGVVHSPLYGPRPARDFYPALFADTSQANLTLKSVMSGKDQAGRTTVSFWFHFDWRLPSGAAAPFDVVDVATLGSDGKIRELHIIYDTVDVRPAFEAEVGHPSWHRPHSEYPVGRAAEVADPSADKGWETGRREVDRLAAAHRIPGDDQIAYPVDETHDDEVDAAQDQNREV